MKKFLWCFALLLLAFPAHAWVFLNEAGQNRSEWLLPKLLSGKPVRVCIDVLEQQRDDKNRRYNISLYQGPQQGEYYRQSSVVVFEAYQRWFDALRNEIEKSGRKKEFADVLAQLPKGPNFSFINIQGRQPYKSCESFPLDQIDLRVRATLWQQNTGGHAVQTSRASFTFHLQPENTGLASASVAVSSGRKASVYIALHEAGHTLGLGDLYMGDDNPANSLMYTLYPMFYARGQRSVMNESSELTCDDMDGLVNLIDLANKKNPSARAAGGWLGFCPQRKLAYVRSLPFKVTDAEEAAQKEYVASGRNGAPPLAAKGAQAQDEALARVQAGKDAALEREAKERQKRTEQALADSLQTAEAIKRMSAVAPPEKGVCPVCGKPLDNEEKLSILTYSKKGVKVYLHSSCNAARKAKGEKLSAQQIQKFGVPVAK